MAQTRKCPRWGGYKTLFGDCAIELQPMYSMIFVVVLSETFSPWPFTQAALRVCSATGVTPGVAPEASSGKGQ